MTKGESASEAKANRAAYTRKYIKVRYWRRKESYLRTK
jgi:hypothetical protein